MARRRGRRRDAAPSGAGRPGGARRRPAWRREAWRRGARRRGARRRVGLRQHGGRNAELTALGASVLKETGFDVILRAARPSTRDPAGRARRSTRIIRASQLKPRSARVPLTHDSPTGPRSTSSPSCSSPSQPSLPPCPPFTLDYHHSTTGTRRAVFDPRPAVRYAVSRHRAYPRLALTRRSPVKNSQREVQSEATKALYSILEHDGSSERYKTHARVSLSS